MPSLRSAVLLPIVLTVWIIWTLLEFIDGEHAARSTSKGSHTWQPPSGSHRCSVRVLPVGLPAGCHCHLPLPPCFIFCRAGFFSPLYNYLFGFHVFGLGFLTTLLFVFGVGGAAPGHY